MAYLLMDLEKPTLTLRDVSPQAKAVMLFTKRKKTRKIAQKFTQNQAYSRVIHTPSGENLTQQIKKQLKKILKKQPTAHILVSSRRKKVARLLDKLLNHYPDAQLVLLDKVLPKDNDTTPPNPKQEIDSVIDVKEEIKTEIAPTEKTQNTEIKDKDTEIKTEKNTETASPKPKYAYHIDKSKATAAQLQTNFVQIKLVPMMPTGYNENIKENPVDNKKAFLVAEALKRLNHFSNNLPKKHADLLKSLQSAFHLDPNEATQVLQELMKLRVLQIDVLGNVKYR